MYKNVTPFPMFWQAVTGGEVISCVVIATITTQIYKYAI